MSTTIWKFPLHILGTNGVITDSPTVEMPAEAQILTMQLQETTPTLWALVDETKPKVIRRFRIVGTGHPMDLTGVTLAYLGTFQYRGYVFHVFEDETA